MWWRGVKIGGDSGCSAASIGYSRRIRKRLIHSRRHTAVMESVSSNKNLAAWLLARGGADARGRARPRSGDPRSEAGTGFAHPIERRPLFQHQIERQDLVKCHRRVLDAVAGRLAVA